MGNADNLHDLPVDDFANDKGMIKKRRLEAEFNKMMYESTEIVTKSFKAKESSHKNLKHFQLHRSVLRPFVFKSYEGKWKNRDIYVCIFKYISSIDAGEIQDRGVNYYFAGVLELHRTYPHTIVQPESFALKIMNLFNRADIDFDQSKKFSRKFHVVSKDKRALETLLFNKDLNPITNYKTAEFELNERQCYFRVDRKPVSQHEAENFVDLAKILMEAF